MSRLTVFFFFNDTATTEIYTLSLHDALPIYRGGGERTGGMMHLLPHNTALLVIDVSRVCDEAGGVTGGRSEEHTSELQSRLHLVCRLLLEKKKKKKSSDAF